MNNQIELIEKGNLSLKRFRNKYLRAIFGWLYCRDACYPSSIFILIAYVPNAWGFLSEDGNFLDDLYSYSISILPLLVGGTTATPIQ